MTPPCGMKGFSRQGEKVENLRYFLMTAKPWKESDQAKKDGGTGRLRWDRQSSKKKERQRRGKRRDRLRLSDGRRTQIRLNEDRKVLRQRLRARHGRDAICGPAQAPYRGLKNMRPGKGEKTQTLPKQKKGKKPARRTGKERRQP